MISRRVCRETALKALYQCDALDTLSTTGVVDFFSHFIGAPNDEDNEPISVPDSEFAKGLVLGVVGNLLEIDGEIARAATNWSVKRMPVIDRNILRIGVYELLFQSATPAKVVINEAIEIAKEFAADETPQFINGVLDKVASSRN